MATGMAIFCKSFLKMIIFLIIILFNKTNNLFKKFSVHSLSWLDDF
jgi:hypothetical protein